MPYARKYYRKKRYGYSAKRGYRKASRYRRRYGGYRRSYGRYGANRKISSINRRLYALLKSMDMRFRYTKPYYSVVDRKKKAKLRKPKSYKSSKAQLAAMEAIKLKAAANMQARHAAKLDAEDVDMPDLESAEDRFAAVLCTQPSLRYSTESLSQLNF